MKHNWEYNKFGDLCDILRGGSPRPIQDYLTEDENGLNWIKIGDAAAGSKYITSTKEKIRPEGLKKTRQVYKGDFILSNSMSFGRPYILKIDGCIHDGWLAIQGVEKYFIPDFLFYFLSSPSTYSFFEKSVKGGVVSNLNTDIVKSIAIPVPPMDVQEQIVAELDGINAQIDRCRELLRTLDSLTTSLFYNTFGDPVTNPKGWEVNLMSSACKLVTDGTHFSPKSFPEGDYMYISAKNIKKNGLDLSNVTFVDAETHTSIYRTCPVKKGDILYIKDGATTGIAIINPIEEEFSLLSSVALLRANQRYICPIYLRDFLNCPTVYQLFRTRMGGAAITRLTLKKINSFKIPIPPLPLQKEFVAQIEAIEAQKAKVEATIKELQTLLDSRMDYWFN